MWSFLESMTVWGLLESLIVIAEGLLLAVDLEILQFVVPPDALFKLLSLPMMRGLMDLNFLTALLSELSSKSHLVDC